jgi:hypothetical protein
LLPIVATADNVQSLFLVGGLGSSLYLLKFLQWKLGGLVKVKQPEAGYKMNRTADVVRYSAIVRGAVLYKLGMDLVKDRVVRASYGTSSLARFQEGHHPISAKVVDRDGLVKCNDVMYWFATKVRPLHDAG